jgi:hypothetical protein
MTLGTLPASELDAEALAEELWQINHSLVESLARLQVAIEHDRAIRATESTDLSAST